jgi:hypothetical protein
LADYVYGEVIPKGKPAEGVKYLLQQLNVSYSAYRVRVAKATAQVWEHWFQKLSEMLVHYDMSAESIIRAVAGHLHADNVIMCGWSNTVDSLCEQHKPVALEVFFTHIREQLFVAMNTRHKAYEELLSLNCIQNLDRLLIVRR